MSSLAIELFEVLKSIVAHERLQGNRIPEVISQFIAAVGTLMAFWDYAGTPMTQSCPVAARFFRSMHQNGVQLLGACANVDQAFLASRLACQRLTAAADAERVTIRNELCIFPSNFVCWLMQQNPVTYTLMERLVAACIHQLDVFRRIMEEPMMDAIQNQLASVPIMLMTRQLHLSAGPDGINSPERLSGAPQHTREANEVPEAPPVATADR